MKTAAVIIDSWKLPVFERLLKEAKYSFINAGMFNAGSLTLQVDYEPTERDKLQALLTKAQDECRKQRISKMN